VIDILDTLEKELNGLTNLNWVRLSQGALVAPPTDEYGLEDVKGLKLSCEVSVKYIGSTCGPDLLVVCPLNQGDKDE